jgi:hypothetical protein
MRLHFQRWIIGGLATLAVSTHCGAETQTTAKLIADSFSQPSPVTINGYDGHIMEPFLSRDGKLLFFNTRNMPKDQTDIHVAGFESNETFNYIGPVSSANSESLDGVASLDHAGNFYFVSNRDFDKSGTTLWSGTWREGKVGAVAHLAADFTPKKLLRLNIDLEVSADGKTLYFAENRWDLFRGSPATSDLAMARLESGTFKRLSTSDFLTKNINTKKLEFAPSTSSDELTLYFTRLDMKAFRKSKPNAFAIMVSTRANTVSAWSHPIAIDAIQGHVEGPTVSPDGCALYFHKLVQEQFRLFRSARKNCGSD